MSGHPLRVELRASPVLTLLTITACASAAGVLFWVLPLPAGAACGLLLAWAGFRAVKEQALLNSGNSPHVLELGQDAEVTLRLRCGTQLRGHATERRYVSRWLVVLTLAGPGVMQRTILVARDMLAAGKFRHLRLWALWGCVPESARASP